MRSRLANFIIHFVSLIYQALISPALHLFFGPQYGCRFTPTCSHYAREATEKHGIWRGGLLALYRISRCQPFAQAGHDPVPHAIARSCFNMTRVSGR